MFTLIGGESAGRLRGTHFLASVVLVAAAGSLGGIAAICRAQATDGDVAQPTQPPARDFSHLAPYWDILSGDDDAAAQAAIEKLSAAPEETLRWIETGLAPYLGDSPAGIANLIRQLDDERFEVRDDAEEWLRSLRWVAENHMRAALADDPPPETRERLRRILADGPGTGPGGQAAHFTRTPFDRGLARVGQVLRNIDSPRTVPLLKALGPAADLTIADARVAPLYEGLFSESDETRAASAMQLIELGEAGLPALPRLIDLLADDQGPRVPIPNSGMQTRVADHIKSALPQFGDAIVEPLIAALADHPEPHVRQRAAQILGNMQDERAIEPLLGALSDPEREVRSAAQRALLPFGEKVVEPLIAVLQGKNPLPQRPLDNRTRYYIAGVLGEIGDARGIKPVAQLLYQEDPLARDWAIEGLRKFGDAAEGELIAALRSSDPNVRDSIKTRTDLVRLIGTPNSKAATEVLIDAARNRHEAIRGGAISQLGHNVSADYYFPRVWELLIAALDDPAPSVRVTAVNMIGYVPNYSNPIHPEDVGARLIRLLDDESFDVRRDAIGALGAWRITEAVDRLLSLLEDEELAYSAAGALGRIGDPRAIEPLRQLLAKESAQEHEDSSRVTWVITALGTLQDSGSVELLIGLLNRDHESIEREAAKALGQIGDPRAVEPLIDKLNGSDQVMRAAARALGQIRDPFAIEPLIAAIDSQRRPSRIIGRPIPQEVLAHEALPSSNPVTRQLQRIGLPAVEPLAEALRHPSQKVREVAAYVLYNLASPYRVDQEDMQPAADSLAAALDDSSQVVRYHAAMALGYMGDRRALPTLIEMIGAENEQRFAYGNAASSFGRIGDPGAIEPLTKWLRDARPHVRRNATRALGSMRSREALPFLLELVDDPEARVRDRVAWSLGRIGEREAVEPLIGFLQDEDAEVRVAAADALGRLGEARATQPLIQAGKDADAELKVNVGIALIRLEHPEGVRIVTECLSDEDRRNRGNAAARISYTAPSSEMLAEPMLAALSDSDPSVRRYAASTLGRTGGEGAVDALLDALSDEEILQGVLEGLGGTRSPRGLAAIIEHLDHPVSEIRMTAITEVARFENEEHVTVLAPLLADPSRDVRLAAIRALRTLNSDPAIVALTAALEDEDPYVQFMAAAALEKIASE